MQRTLPALLTAALLGCLAGCGSNDLPTAPRGKSTDGAGTVPTADATKSAPTATPAPVAETDRGAL
jgi:hypothetical protein